jgi:hypothetical protein
MSLGRYATVERSNLQVPFFDILTLSTSPNKLGSLLLRFALALWNEWKNQGTIQLRRLFKEFWPIMIYIGATAMLLLFAGLSLLKFLQDDRSLNWRLRFWISAASAVVSMLPLASKVAFRTRYRLTIALEVAVLGLTLTLFAKIILRLPFFHRWTLCAVLLILLLSVGGHGIELLHDSISARLAREWEESPGSHEADESAKNLVKSHLILMRKYFIEESAIYSALPVGTLVGLFCCWVLGVDFSRPLAVVTVCLCCVFGLAGIVVILFLVSSSIRMSDPMLLLPFLHSDDLKTGLPSASDWGCILTEYRKMFFFDAMLNTALLFAFGILEWFLLGHQGLAVGDPKFVATVLVISILLNEVPYLIGQKRVQELLVFPYRGWEKSKKTKEVDENIPLVPKFEFIAALIGDASAGGLALEMTKQITEAISKHS